MAGRHHVSIYLVLDDGAINALTKQGRDIAYRRYRRKYAVAERSDLVACIDKEGREYARGLVSYSADDAQQIIGKPSSQIEQILGAVTDIDLIHRDNMIVHH